jgi:hypothetical protein
MGNMFGRAQNVVDFDGALYARGRKVELLEAHTIVGHAQEIRPIASCLIGTEARDFTPWADISLCRA